MLSILIPTYHYNVYPLAQELEKQALQLDIPFELICMDDGSFSPLNETNQKINTLTNCQFIENKKNVGRVGNRLLLAKKAQYNWLLFLDSDVLPKHPDFLKTTISKISQIDFDAAFGGFAYDTKSYEPEKSLRFTFGRLREEVPAEKRTKNPYKVIISANMLIKKDVYLVLAEMDNSNAYGMDYLLGSLLKSNGYEVLHYDNEVYHNGLENNLKFLSKTKQALENLHELIKKKKIGQNQISVLKAYRILHFLKLNNIFSKVIFVFKNPIESNLLGAKPNLFLFDLYRLAYLCGL